MKIALIGATGNVGSRLLAEALRRGHAVSAVVRHPDKVPAQPGVVARQGDVTEPEALAVVLAGHDAVISSMRLVETDPMTLIGAVKRAGVPRLLAVGSAGSLEVAPGVQLVDTPQFPAAYRAEALAGRAFLNALRQERELAWTFVSPSALFLPGERTGRFRLGTNRLLIAAAGKSWISFEDFAVALFDELERPRHARARFTVGY